MLYLYTYLNVLYNSLKEEKGQGMAEYGLILALIAIAVVAALITMEDGISTILEGIGGSLENVNTTITQ